MSILNNYSRKPVMYVTIPSNGVFNDDLVLSSTKEVGIMPQTLLNEVSLQNPEELLNGEALIKLIKDCTDINVDPKELPKVDIDHLLVAIRVATHGDVEEYELTCSKCGNTHTYSHNVGVMLAKSTSYQEGDNIVEFKIEYPDAYRKFKAYLRPFSYGTVLASEHSNFNHRQELLALNESVKSINETTSEQEIIEMRDKIYKQMNELYQKLGENFVEYHSKDITKVEVYILDDDGNEVELEGSETEHEEIKAWFKSLSKKHYDLIKEKFNHLNHIGIDDLMEFKCPEEECGHTWVETFEVNRTDFFVKSS